MVTEEQIRFFDENGYLKYGKVLEPSEVQQLIEGLGRVVHIELEGGDDSSVEFSIGHRHSVLIRNMLQSKKCPKIALLMGSISI